MKIDIMDSWVMPFISGRELMNLFGKRKAIKIECAFFVIKTNDLFFKFGSFFFCQKLYLVLIYAD